MVKESRGFKERWNYMVKEEESIFIRRCIAIGIIIMLLLFAFIPWGGKLNSNIKPKLISHKGYLVNDSYEGYSEGADYRIELVFDESVSDCYAVIDVFDSNGNYFKTLKENFYGTHSYYTDTVYSSDIYLPKNASYKIVSYDASAAYASSAYDYMLRWLIYTLIVCIGLIPVLFLLYACCNIYLYNGKEIIVFAGINKHYIKIGGEILDEYNSTFYFHIDLSCEDGEDRFEAIVSATNSIRLKANGKLIRPLSRKELNELRFKD